MKLYKIKDVKLNPANPRIIKDDKFAKLVQSLKEFPEMANIRPIVCNTDMVILGGNMRFKAMQAAGWKEVPVEVVDWPEDKQAEFVIKDNVSGGEWDWDMLANQWDAEKLEAWGLDLPVLLDAEEPDDLSDKITETFRIEVICENEQEQQQAYNKLIEEGYLCRLLTL
jgi:ParB-like chromosome segregation protein Spo0J